MYFVFDPPAALIKRMAVVAYKLAPVRNRADYDKITDLAEPLWQEIKQHPDRQGVMPAILEYDKACKAALSRIAAANSRLNRS